MPAKSGYRNVRFADDGPIFPFTLPRYGLLGGRSRIIAMGSPVFTEEVRRPDLKV